MSDNYYLIDEDGYFVNVVVWDGEVPVDFGAGITAVRVSDTPVSPPQRPQEQIEDAP